MGFGDGGNINFFSMKVGLNPYSTGVADDWRWGSVSLSANHQGRAAPRLNPYSTGVADDWRWGSVQSLAKTESCHLLIGVKLVLILILVEVGFGESRMLKPSVRNLRLNPYSSGGGVRCENRF